jgi:pimeloyl-ACP methyl ester carboxylesterase
MVDVDGGRVVDVVDAGGGGAGTLVFHSGTPMGPTVLEPLASGAAARGLRLITPLRPGYAASTPSPGRIVADVVPDVRAALDACGVDSYVAVGHSGGGPHALACRALDPRCAGVVTIASVAPHDADGLDFLAGMGDDNVEEFTAARTGDPALAEFVGAAGGGLAGIDAASVIEGMASLLSAADRTVLTPDVAAFLADALRTGVAAGIAGWHDDDIAFVQPWGFSLDSLTRVSIWQGSEDLMVPFAHGRWLAEVIPTAQAHLLDGEGHMSVLVGRIEEILDEALALVTG